MKISFPHQMCEVGIRVANGPGRAVRPEGVKPMAQPRGATEPVDWSTGRAGPLIYLRPVGPQAGWAWRARVKIKIIFNFGGKGFESPSLIEP